MPKEAEMRAETPWGSRKRCSSIERRSRSAITGAPQGGGSWTAPRDPVALAALDLAAQVEVQVARVEQPRQVVGDRELLGALEEDGVLDRDRAGLDEGQHEGEVWQAYG